METIKIYLVVITTIFNCAWAFRFPRNVGVVVVHPPSKFDIRRAAGMTTGLRDIIALSSTMVDSPPSSSIIAEDDLESSASDRPFDWFKSWHPIVPVEFLDIERPHAFKLLGMDIVVWNDGPVGVDVDSHSDADVNNDNNSNNRTESLFRPRKLRARGARKSTNGNWRAFVNACPHRGVPLSEGRVEDDGSLLCSYHGWRFDGTGEALAVPQASDVEFEKIKSNPKSRCGNFPVRVVDGVLWVWPDVGENSGLEAALSPVPITLRRRKQELPYGHDYFIENVVDPAHVPVSHHNILGSRYSEQTLHMETIQPLTKSGFGISVTSPLLPDVSSTTTFTAPSQVLIKSPFGKMGARQYLELYSSPSRPGFTNHVGRMVVVKDESTIMPNLLRQFMLPMPVWANHLLASLFLNQDALFLHGQERAFTFTGKYRTTVPSNDSYAQNVLRTSSDRGVMLFRDWLSKFAHGHIPFRGDTTMPPTSKEAVFDVWNAHTRHCKYCLDALARIRTARKLTFLASALVATIRPRVLGTLGSTMTALGLSGLGLVLSKLIGMFYRFEFSHAENH
ncbi:hypothetical protein ACHAXA_006419 [Cyclostephanos tholiformis]|uniref:Rieske domain-containing protein n=1 Tax=Cyclostephanos tholiformis TaxID=382380 RepID=A0ABD3R0K5_9STRA